MEPCERLRFEPILIAAIVKQSITQCTDAMSKNLDEKISFSLVQGGALYQFYLSSGLVRPPFHLTPRTLFIPLLAWLPLLLLSLLAGVAVSGVTVPFIFDLDVHIRFLGALSLLLIAEVIVYQQMPIIVRQFLERDIIEPKELGHFKAIIASANNLRNSKLIEIFLIVLAFTGGHWLWQQVTMLNVSTWYAQPINGKANLTMAGYWYSFVSMPIFQFLAFRWYFRILIWYRFLWQVSRLPLHLNALHPDRAGGLGFLSYSAYALSPFLMAHTVLLAGVIINRIWYTGAVLTDFRAEVFSIVIFLMIIVFTPLVFFIFHLSREKRAGLEKYGIVASRYVNEFRQKWMAGVTEEKKLLGTPDIQSLADLGNSFGIELEMRVFPFSRKILVELTILLILPFIPLILMMVPVAEMATRLVKIVL